MNKIKVGFEITDSWNKADFRLFIQYLLDNPDKYDVYLISNYDSSSYILQVGQILNIASDHIIVVNFTSDKINAINSIGINIYLDNIQHTVMLIEETTDCYGVLVDEIPNRYKFEPKYITTFNNIINYKLNNDNNQVDNCG